MASRCTQNVSGLKPEHKHTRMKRSGMKVLGCANGSSSNRRTTVVEPPLLNLAPHASTRVPTIRANVFFIILFPLASTMPSQDYSIFLLTRFREELQLRREFDEDRPDLDSQGELLSGFYVHLVFSCGELCVLSAFSLNRFPDADC